MSVPFALAPGLIKQADIINYSTREGQKVFDIATKPLHDEFALDHTSLHGFLEQLRARAMITGWNDILLIPTDLTQPNETVDILSLHGSLSLEQISAHALTYVNTETRAAQDSIQLYTCIINSLTKTAQTSVTLLKSEYTIDDAQPIVSGTCLLKVVIRKSQIDTNATTSHIIEKLGRIDKIVIAQNSDIEKVNETIKALIEELATRGETTQHLVINLFEGYKVASDRNFVAYIKRKQDDYNDGKSTLTPDTLMYLTTNYYNTLLEAGDWDQPSQEDEKIIALEAQVKKLQQPKPKNNVTPTNANKGNNNTQKQKQGRQIPLLRLSRLTYATSSPLG